MVDLVADIGGTNARFALWQDTQDSANRLRQINYFKTGDFPSLAIAIEAYCKKNNVQPTRLSLAVAGPVETDFVSMSNNNWSFSKTELKQTLKLERLTVINDFTAQALLPPALSEADKHPIREGTPLAGTPVTILGAGTGLGMSALIPLHKSGSSEIEWRALEAEGGNVPFAPRDAEEQALMQFIARETGRTVSFEDVLSGRGLERAYRYFAGDRQPVSAADITAQASDNPLARQAVNLFLNCLSNFVLHAVMMVGARQGVYLSGGIVPRLLPYFEKSAFAARLSEYGIFTDYIAAVPVWLITIEEPGLTGAGLALSNPYLQHRTL